MEIKWHPLNTKVEKDDKTLRPMPNDVALKYGFLLKKEVAQMELHLIYHCVFK